MLIPLMVPYRLHACWLSAFGAPAASDTVDMMGLRGEAWAFCSCPSAVGPLWASLFPSDLAFGQKVVEDDLQFLDFALWQ